MRPTAGGVYNKRPAPGRKRWTTASVACMTKPVAPGGRPTDDPKGTLVAVRLAARHVRVLEQRSRRDDTGLSEALRRCVDEWAAAQGARARPSPRTKQAVLKQPAPAAPPRPTRRRTRRSAT